MGYLCENMHITNLKAFGSIPILQSHWCKSYIVYYTHCIQANDKLIAFYLLNLKKS